MRPAGGTFRVSISCQRTPSVGEYDRINIGLRFLQGGDNQHSATPNILNQTTRHWHADSARKHIVSMYAGRDVYESHGPDFATSSLSERKCYGELQGFETRL